MVDERHLIGGKQRIKRTARQTAKFLIEYFDGDDERLTWLLAKFVVEAVFGQSPKDLIYWARVFWLCKRATLSGKPTRELMLLREHSDRQGH
jgi:hypothetical protein